MMFKIALKQFNRPCNRLLMIMMNCLVKLEYIGKIHKITLRIEDYKALPSLKQLPYEISSIYIINY